MEIFIVMGVGLLIILILLIRNPPSIIRDLQLARARGLGEFFKEFLHQYVAWATGGSYIGRRLGIGLNVAAAIFFYSLELDGGEFYLGSLLLLNAVVFFFFG